MTVLEAALVASVVEFLLEVLAQTILFESILFQKLDLRLIDNRSGFNNQGHCICYLNTGTLVRFKRDKTNSHDQYKGKHVFRNTHTCFNLHNMSCIIYRYLSYICTYFQRRRFEIPVL